MRRAAACAALLAGVLGAAPALALSEGVERAWAVHWRDDARPGTRDVYRELVLCAGQVCAWAAHPRLQVQADGSRVWSGWWIAPPEAPAPTLRGRWWLDAGTSSPLSAPVIPSDSVAYASPVPEPSVGVGVLVGFGAMLSVASHSRVARIRSSRTSSHCSSCSSS